MYFVAISAYLTISIMIQMEYKKELMGYIAGSTKENFTMIDFCIA